MQNETPPSPSSKSPNPLWIVLGLSVGFFVLFIGLSASVYFLMRGGSDRPSKASLFSSGRVGVIELKGVIMDSKKILKTLESFSEDSSIRAVVLRLDSPGGSVAPSQEIYEAVKAFPKPIVASMASVAASGAYYIACGTKKVFANPGTITGSIGVIMEFVNLEKLMDWAKVQRFSIKTGKYKDSGASYRSMAPEEREHLQSMVNDVLSQFKAAVKEGRKLSTEQVDAVADGRIFSGAQAKRLKLVDELGGINEAIEEAAKIAMIPGKVEVVYPERRQRPRFMDLLFEDAGPDEESSSAAHGGGLVGEFLRFIAWGERSAVQGTPSLPTSAPGVYWLWTGSQ